ncbi:Crp/Fnr family transcriptional regulator [Sutcliffiella cohnii]|uniref:Crp/Fnr family transcriptional regulator n=1 Tax=Sutcliffiella cohnii TaxID=33932 RepID=A0A223KLL8_9BACI|nr:Crp/Fnr family transcriptional regulator [Sutcliffiella cohnii]AST90400.1 Crp/Fnr family transcriptional regulator [Sutcliffiella cohnii]MED4017484.1 Crp/Fnr family transcriptional regulator [Sutcliffiella cohnii]
MPDKLSKELKQFLYTFEKKINIKKGTYLFHEGETANEIYLILSGKVQMSKITPDGQELTMRLCSEDDIVGELTLFTDGALYLLNAKVMEDGTAIVIPKDELEIGVANDSKIAVELMKWMSIHFRKTQTKFRDLVLKGKKGGLYSTLIRMTNSYGVMKPNGILIDTPLTNQDLANYCGTSREVVNRMLSELKKNEILSVEKGKITIHDLNFLKLEIDCENCPVELCSID